MKIAFLPFALLLFPLLSFSQIKTEHQPKTGYYDSVKTRCVSRTYPEEELLAEKIQELPAGFLDSLKKYDWYEVASYHYSETKYSSPFTNINEREIKYANVELHFKRFEADGVVMEMQLNRLKNGSLETTTTTFDKAIAQKLIAIEKIKGQARMVTEIYGEQEKQKIVSYHNGILILEASMNPEIQTNQTYRIEWVAIPKMF